MRTETTIAGVRRTLHEWRRAGDRIGFVPTMGALHRGHLTLVGAVRERAERSVASVFVNPKQFGPTEDLDRYPRDLEGDARKLEEEGVDLLFAPPVEEVYPPGFATTVHVAGVSEGMEGARRPGHFDGVATVVARLFGIVLPDVAAFGQKDAQQAAVVRRMTADLGLPIEVLVVPTARESDGLALSSRNVYLGPEERRAAPALFRALLAGHLVHELGERDARKIVTVVGRALGTEPAVRLEGLDLVDAETMRPLEKVDRPALLAVSAWVGRTRLIDNVVLGAKSVGQGPRPEAGGPSK